MRRVPIIVGCLLLALVCFAATQSQFFSGDVIVAGQVRDAGGTNYLREAPLTGTNYVRSNAVWVPMPPSSGGGITDAPSTGYAFVRKDADWTTLSLAWVNEMDASGDGQTYGRRNNAWYALGDAALLDLGTTAGTVSEGNHNHASLYAALTHTHAWADITGEPDFATNGHVHAGEDITSGTVGTARLGSGTANSSVFLRGDGTWATVTVDPGNTNGLVDAPSDGVFYGRKDAGWVNPGMNDLSDGGDIVTFDDLIDGITAGPSTFTGSLTLSGIGSDISSGGSYSFLLFNPSGNTVGRTSPTYARGLLDAAAASHNHDGTYSPVSHDHDGTYAPVSRSVLTTNSLTGGGSLASDRTLSLVGDSASPGNDRYYGTDSGGTKGFHSFPAVFNPLVLVTTSAVTDSNQDTTFRSVRGTVKSGYSATITADTLPAGTVLTFEASGVFTGDPGYDCDLEIRIGSSLALRFDVNESGSMGADSGTPWHLRAFVTISTAGSSASVIVSGIMTYHDSGSSGSYESGYALATKPVVSGTLNTTVSNTIDLQYRANDTAMTSFTCSHLIAWKH